MQRRLVTHHNRRSTRNRQLDANVKMSSVVSMTMSELDEYATPDDAGVELFEPGHTLANVGLEVVRVW
jgi:hypothetical protein